MTHCFSTEVISSYRVSCDLSLKYFPEINYLKGIPDLINGITNLFVFFEMGNIKGSRLEPL